MLTLDNHLIGVTADRPHPDGYRPDFPLRSDLFAPDAVTEAHDEGYDEGHADARTHANIQAEEAESDHAAVVATLRAQRDEAKEETATLRRQLEAKRA
jgi:hypothetical protein